MAVVSVRTKPDWEGGATSERNGLLYEVVRRRYKMTKTVRVSHLGDGPETILAAPSVPQIGQAYNLFNDADALATCVSVTPRRTAAPLTWEVDCEFDTARVVAGVTDNPLNQPALISWTFNKYERPMLRSYDNGIACVTSSGNVYDPPLVYEDARPCVTITRNEASYSPANAITYHNCLNKEAFATAAPLCAKVNYITAAQQFSNGVAFYQVTYEIEINRESFAQLILDQDFRDIEGKMFRDPVTAASMSAPTLLNGRGRRRTDARGNLSASMTAGQSTVPISSSSLPLFPVGQEPVNGDGYRPSGDWTFVVKIEDELLLVNNDRPAASPWNVTRGYGGTTAAAHAVDKVVTLEPYFKRYIPYPVKSFTPLALPTV